MRLLGIDLGTKTMGLAITDSNQVIASGIENFSYSHNDLSQCTNKIKQLIDYYKNDIETIVIGYPKTTSGVKNERTLLVEKFVDTLKRECDLPIKYQDERFSTQTATGILKYEVGLKASKIKKIKDKMSAVVILQEYMEWHQ
jgi:putative Holliday junction resolvase